MLEIHPFWKSKFEEFIKWAKDYDEVKGIANRNIEAHKKWLAKQDAKVVNLTGDLSIEEKIKLILDEIKRINPSK